MSRAGNSSVSASSLAIRLLSPRGRRVILHVSHAVTFHSQLIFTMQIFTSTSGLCAILPAGTFATYSGHKAGRLTGMWCGWFPSLLKRLRWMLRESAKFLHSEYLIGL